MTQNLYRWLGLGDDVLEKIIADGGDWRSKIRRLLIEAVAKADRSPLVYRLLGGDALIVDGRVRQWELGANGASPEVARIFRLLHRDLAEEIGKPWWPELSPTSDTPIAELFTSLGFRRNQDGERVERPLTAGSLVNGPWIRHLSRLERNWLEQRLREEAAIYLTSALACSITTVSWTWPESAIGSEHISLNVLTSAARGSGGHFDRWATSLPTIDANMSDSDRTVRLTFRAMASRLAQNGRFVSRRHMYFVANLWEPKSLNKEAMPNHLDADQLQKIEPTLEEGSFARATEFVFTSTAMDRKDLSAHDPREDGVRTLTYLALLQETDMTLHDIAQTLFSQRRPVLRVAPCPISEGWSFTGLEPRDDHEGRSVPAIVKIRVPRFNTYPALRDHLIRSLQRTLATSRLLDAFAETIWSVVPGDLYAFPWDSDAHDKDEPAQFGIHAQALIGAIRNELNATSERWTLFFKETEDDFNSFSTALISWFSELHTPTVDTTKLSVADETWRRRVYHMLLANSLHFDSESLEHRQVPIAMGSSGTLARFLPAGIYLVTYGSGNSHTADEAFVDALSQVNSLHINNHAARAILSIAATRTLRRQMLVEEEVAVQQQRLASEAAKIRDAIERERKASDAARSISQAIREIQKSVMEVLSVPAKLWELWFGDGDDAHLSMVGHPVKIDAQYFEHCHQAITKVQGWLGPLATEGGESFVGKIQAVAVAKDETRSLRIGELKAYARLWKPDEQRHPTLPEVVQRQVGRKMILLEPSVNSPRQYYPSVPAVWVKAFTALVSNADSEGVRVTPFVYEERDTTIAGFVSVNRLASGDTDWVREAVIRYTNILGVYAEPYIGICNDGNVKWHDDADPLLPGRLTDIGGQGLHAIVVFKGIPLKSAKGRIG